MKSVLCTDNTFCQSGVVGAFCGIEVLWIVGPGLVARSDMFGVVHKSFPDQVVVLRSVLFLAFAFSAHLTREVLSEQVGVGVLCFLHLLLVHI